jgi:hypothetical protein
MHGLRAVIRTAAIGFEYREIVETAEPGATRRRDAGLRRLTLGAAAAMGIVTVQQRFQRYCYAETIG